MTKVLRERAHRDDTCGSCAFFDRWAYGKNYYMGRCRCWAVKGKDGEYEKKAHDAPACAHYLQQGWAGIDYRE